MTTPAFSRGWSSRAAAWNPLIFAVVVTVRRIRRRLRVRRDRMLLEALPNHLLADLGLSRSELDRVTLSGRDHRPRPGTRL